MKAISIKGKDYITVNERLKYFRENFKGYRLLSELVSNEMGVCVFKATVYNVNGEPVAIGIDTSVASADEVANAIKQQESGKVKKADDSILARIKNSKTVEELEDIYGNLTAAEQPLYLDKLGLRKAVLKANAKHN